jgi:hypothetical protein
VSFPLPTASVSANTTATITASWNGATKSGGVTLTPQPAPSGVTLSPTSVVGTGGSSFGRVTIAAAQSTDTTLQLTSSNPAVASVNNGVTIPAGTTAGGFNVFTSQVTTQTNVTISVSGGGVAQSATLTVLPDAGSPTATLTLTASGRSGERVTSTPAGLSVAVGSTGSASFTVGASITLTVSNGRDAVWSGACSSSGSKRRSCTFTLGGSGSVSANVQ